LWEWNIPLLRVHAWTGQRIGYAVSKTNLAVWLCGMEGEHNPVQK
jgi:hypothetical protein